MDLPHPSSNLVNCYSSMRERSLRMGWRHVIIKMMYKGVYQACLKGRILGSIRKKRGIPGYLFPITRLTQGCGRSFQKLATRICVSVYRNSYFWLWFNWHQAASVISSLATLNGLWRPPFLAAQTSGYPTQGWNTWESSKQYEKISSAELLVVPYAVRQKCASSTKYTLYTEYIVYLSVCAQVYTWGVRLVQYIHESLDAPWQVHSHFVDLLWVYVEPVSLHRHKNIFNASRKQSSNISQTYIESLP